MKQLNIGLFGFGVVGEGIYQVLQQKPNLNCHVKRICIKQPGKARHAPAELFTSDAGQILDDPEINVVVELIDDAAQAFDIVCGAMQRGKHVVSANKKMIAEHLQELIALRNACRVSFLYEGAVCGSIPIIRNLEEYFDNDLLQSVTGIVNGSTNFILSEMSDRSGSYTDALAQAQALGFAESDPTLDVEGHDAAYKLAIILSHAFGRITEPAEIIRRGIGSVSAFDIRLAKERGYAVKLIAQASASEDGLTAHVLPRFVHRGTALSGVNAEYNGIEIGSALADKQLLVGKGAGRFPTSSAVLSDISALRYGYRYEYKKLREAAVVVLNEDASMRVYLGYDSAISVDPAVFGEIEERHSGKEGSYVIGTVNIRSLKETAYWTDPRCSVIQMP